MASSQSQQTTASIHILGHDYFVSCPENERETLEQSAELLGQRMTSLKQKSRNRSDEHIAVMVGLNLARELLDLQTRMAELQDSMASQIDDDTRQRLDQLQQAIDQTLDH